MRGALGPVWTIAHKDVLLELRNREIVLALLVFSFIVLVVFNFAVALTPANAGVVGPGVLWVAITFAAGLPFNVPKNELPTIAIFAVPPCERPVKLTATSMSTLAPPVASISAPNSTNTKT